MKDQVEKKDKIRGQVWKGELMKHAYETYGDESDVTEQVT